MNLLNRIFRRNSNSAKVQRVEVSGFNPVFTAWNGSAYSNDIYREAVDAIARNAAKLKPSHIITFSDDSRAEGRSYINRLLQIAPNEYMTAYDMLYKLATHYYLHNNAFAYLLRDDRGYLAAVYPIRPTQADFMSDAGGHLFVKFYFANGKTYILPYSDIVHLRRFYNSNDFLGDDNDAINAALELAHTQNEGIINGIKSGVSLRGILHFTQTLAPSILEENKQKFVSDYLTLENGSGVVATDATMEYTPIENKSVLVDPAQDAATKTKIYNYLGINEKIVNSSYTDEEWQAFYESVIEPFALVAGLEFTRKVFSAREIAFGNSIIFESSRLQFMSNSNKITMLKEVMPMGLLTINQALELLNLPSVPDGDRRIQSLNYIEQSHATAYQLKQLTKYMEGQGGANEVIEEGATDKP